MRKVIENLIKTSFINKNERFFGGALENNIKKISGMETIAMILSLIIMQMLLLFFGKFLWNTYLVPSIEIVKPIDSVWNLLGISILLKLLL